MNDTKPKFRIFRSYSCALNHAQQLVTDTSQPHCLWGLGEGKDQSFLVTPKGFDPRKAPPTGRGILMKLRTITLPHGVTNQSQEAH